MPFDAVLLAGGRARRFGADKPAAALGGRTLLEWAAGAASGASQVIVVGPPRDVLPGAVVVREDPPGAGPVPALRAGLARVRAPWLAVLAADLPFLRPAHVARLLDAAGQRAGAVLVDDEGREQWLAGCWRAAPLRDALAGYAGESLRGLLGPLDPALVALPSDTRPAWYDCDTPEDLAAAEHLL
ncbi:molybdenum cofactor guanylyltransferase [Actinomadura sp. KC216]|uniref:molybdenum cofactor guanylyltransferase n=1 Tax=Actinomadura sp. KC216 TaxID=2530370 RepID=UPI00104A8D95|nr:molybdenum cofactor guanylyltransferase [Actinomadura sp. KC216]TDB85875.1 molybdenum cofactor guanylyltransferase [Actinomadura sp. KC216]